MPWTEKDLQKAKSLLGKVTDPEKRALLEERIAQEASTIEAPEGTGATDYAGMFTEPAKSPTERGLQSYAEGIGEQKPFDLTENVKKEYTKRFGPQAPGASIGNPLQGATINPELKSASGALELYEPPIVQPPGTNVEELGGAEVRYFHEPSLDRFRAKMAKLFGPDGAAYAETIGEESPHYQAFADTEWKRFAEKARADGRPAIRKAYAGDEQGWVSQMNEFGYDAPRATTAAGEGAIRTASFGLAPTLPGGEERAERYPGSAFFGELLGGVIPGGVASRVAGKLGGGLLRNVAAGAATGAAEAGGQEAAAALGSAGVPGYEGRQAPSAADYFIMSLLGGSGAVPGELIGKGAKGFTETTARKIPELAETRAAGVGLDLRKAPQQLEDILETARREAVTPEEVAARPFEKPLTTAAAKRSEGVKRTAKKESGEAEVGQIPAMVIDSYEELDDIIKRKETSLAPPRDVNWYKQLKGRLLRIKAEPKGTSQMPRERLAGEERVRYARAFGQDEYSPLSAEQRENVVAPDLPEYIKQIVKDPSGVMLEISKEIDGYRKALRNPAASLERYLARKYKTGWPKMSEQEVADMLPHYTERIQRKLSSQADFLERLKRGEFPTEISTPELEQRFGRSPGSLQDLEKQRLAYRIGELERQEGEIIPRLVSKDMTWEKMAEAKESFPSFYQAGKKPRVAATMSRDELEASGIDPEVYIREELSDLSPEQQTEVRRYQDFEFRLEPRTVYAKELQGLIDDISLRIKKKPQDTELKTLRRALMGDRDKILYLAHEDDLSPVGRPFEKEVDARRKVAAPISTLKKRHQKSLKETGDVIERAGFGTRDLKTKFGEEGAELTIPQEEGFAGALRQYRGPASTGPKNKAMEALMTWADRNPDELRVISGARSLKRLRDILDRGGPRVGLSASGAGPHGYIASLLGSPEALRLRAEPYAAKLAASLGELSETMTPELKRLVIRARRGGAKAAPGPVAAAAYGAFGDQRTDSGELTLEDIATLERLLLALPAESVEDMAEEY